MKITPQKAQFAFRDFKVYEFSYKEPAGSAPDLNLNFNALSGVLDVEEGLFETTFKIQVFETINEKKVYTIKCSAKSLFKVEWKTIEEIPQMFFNNSTAIVFPYIRAFITTLTLQSNCGQLMVPILNLSKLAGPLAKNSVVGKLESPVKKG